ncbi:MAG: AmmeMemoRadiSam system protein B [Nitrospirota bacterium]|nr:AmmeMemoRadiSam system protein B [Nitrospirota bacterium]
MHRTPAVAGKFYDGSSLGLRQQVEQYVVPGQPPMDAVGIMVPHAGLIYSGSVAGQVYSSISMPKTFIMLGPNHTGLGPAISIMDAGSWEVPTGSLSIDRRLASRVLQGTELAVRDSQAHAYEHSLEVQLPFITWFSQDVSIVPIAIMTASYNNCRELAEAIAKAIQGVDYPVTILASSDMSHYVSDKIARQKDKKAIEKILDLDPRGLYDTVMHERISMCGVLPATVMLIAAQLLGAKNARLINYMTSGDVSGDYDSVVGYAGIVVSK